MRRDLGGSIGWRPVDWCLVSEGFFSCVILTSWPLVMNSLRQPCKQVNARSWFGISADPVSSGSSASHESESLFVSSGFKSNCTDGLTNYVFTIGFFSVIDPSFCCLMATDGLKVMIFCICLSNDCLSFYVDNFDVSSSLFVPSSFSSITATLLSLAAALWAIM